MLSVRSFVCVIADQARLRTIFYLSVKVGLKHVPKEHVSFSVNQAMLYFMKEKRIRHPFTYSPEIEGVLQMHEGNGARRSGVIKKHARIPSQFILGNGSGQGIIDEGALSAYLKGRKVAPGMLHVAVMDYAPELIRLRESQQSYLSFWPLRLMSSRPAT